MTSAIKISALPPAGGLTGAEIVPLVQSGVTRFTTIADIIDAMPALATGHYSVKDFGAVGNGTANDTAAIQAALTAVRDAGGGTAFFPPGNYKVSTPLVVSSNTTMQGDAGTTIVVDAALPLTSALIINEHNSGASGLTTSDVRVDQNILITGLTFNGAARTYVDGVTLNGYIIQLNGCTNVRVENCIFKNHGAMVILFQGCLQSGTQNNYITNCGRRAFSTHAINFLQIGTVRFITRIVTGNPTLLTIGAGVPASWTTGTAVLISGVDGVGGLIPDASYVVTAVDANTVSIPINSTGASPYVMAGNAQATSSPYWGSSWTWSINDVGKDNRRGLIQAGGDWVNIIGAQSYNSREGCIYLSAARHVVIDGCQLYHSVFDDIVSDLIEVNFGVDVTIANCQLRQSDFAPLGVVGCIGLRVVNCRIENGGTGSPYAISLVNSSYFPVRDFEISGNSFVDQRATPLMTSGVWLTKSGINNQIFNGRIHDNNFMMLGQRARVTGISNANPAVLTTPYEHGLISGQQVYIRGAIQPAAINGGPYAVTVLSTTTFSVAIDTSAAAVFVGSRVFVGTVDPAIGIVETNATTGDGVRYANNLGVPQGALGATDEIVGAGLVNNNMTGMLSFTMSNYQSPSLPGYITNARARITASENMRLVNRQNSGLVIERPSADMATLEAQWTIAPIGTSNNLLIRSDAGAGTLQFGTLTASADAPVTGYITIADQNGVVRKLAVIA